MKKTILSLTLACSAIVPAAAQGWPAEYEGVMLQGFYWDSFVETQWTNLERQSDELSRFFNLIWVPQSGNCNSGYNVMGYMPVYLFDHNSSFGTETALRSMISTFKKKGTGIIADVVINHRNNLGVNGSWVDYPAETYKGVTYQMLPSDIVANDDNGGTRTWASQNGISLSANNDTGEGWDGCRDMDHMSLNVRNNYKAYLDFLLNDLGYAGFRYDMVKGYSPAFTAEYNTATNPTFSVGECWDNTNTIKNWINGTKLNNVPQSAAFDFQFRYEVRDAVNQGKWNTLVGNDKNPLIRDANYRRYAVTFVENHDTQYRSADYPLDPLKKDTLAANAFLLAMPGTPCVFLPHWVSHKASIKSMINARRLAGIQNTSEYTPFTSSSATDHYAVRIRGAKADLICVVGDAMDKYTPSASTYVLILEGPKYRYYVSKSARQAWVDVASGEFTEGFVAKAVAATDDAAATLVYTLDGSDPKASSTAVPANGQIAINETCTLKVGLLSNGVVTGISTREYVVKPFTATTATVYVRNENNWANTNFYVWDSNNNTQLNGGWPGKRITETRNIDGKDWHYQTVDITNKDYYFNLVVSTGTGSPQTVDIPQINADRYYVITTKMQNGKYLVEDVTSTITSVSSLIADPATSVSRSNELYDLSGRRVYRPVSGRLYIDGNGQKVFK